MIDTPAAQPIVVFQHIPKTAGTTLRHIFKQFYSSEETLEVDHNVADLETIARDDTAMRRLKLVYGHSAYRFLGLYDGPVRLVSFVRDPFSRFASHYHFVRFVSDHPQHKQALSTSIEEFIEESGLDDFQARMLAFEGIPGGFSGAALEKRGRLYLEAVRNLQEEFLFVGVAERFDESIVLLGKLLGWPRLPVYASLNVGDKSRRSEELYLRRNEIETAYLGVDKLVYDQCLRRFEREWDADRKENEGQLAELRATRGAVEELLRVREDSAVRRLYLRAGLLGKAAYMAMQSGKRLSRLYKERIGGAS